MVLQQTREIAILKSCGASNAFVIRQVLGEAMLLSAAGAMIGVAMSFGAAWAVATFAPLYTVTITWPWLALAAAAAVGGAAVSSLYPAWRATRVDMVAALTYE
jgi:putative ABC transport system permease protein